MKRENLTDGGFHRVTSKRNRDLLIWQRGANTHGTLWMHTTKTAWDVSLDLGR